MDYLEGALPESGVAALEAHVRGCPRCLAFLASYKATPGIFRDATTVDLSPEQRSALRAFLKTRRN
jgi:hypothetical protein